MKQDVPVLQALRAEKVYPNGTRALSDVRLDIAEGEFVSLLGPSGCGKSTLLRMFAGLELPSAGQVRLWNGTQPPLSGSGHTLSMVFQEATLMPWADVATNVRLPFDLAGLPRETSAPRVAKVLALVGLDRFAHAHPRELSGGMQMRAAIARALVNEPDLLLMDEPFGALDEFTRNRLDGELRKIWAGRKLTVVFVTHSIYEAVFLSTRIVVMGTRPGRVLADIPVSGPVERDENWRVSAPFIETCQQLSRLLAEANSPDDELERA